MNQSVYQINIADLLWAFLPIVVVLTIFKYWALEVTTTLHGMARMVIQLILIGYALTYIFAVNNPLVVIGILSIMLAAAGFIALRPVKHLKNIYGKALASIAVGSIFTLFIVAKPVLDLTPWYAPRYLIPLAGMIFATAMNAVSLAAERFDSEQIQGKSYDQAKAIALKASLIPITNSLFAVGLVSLPGMMTGQILSGISPLIAVRYQIMVMCMVYGSAGIAAAMFLWLQDTPKSKAA